MSDYEFHTGTLRRTDYTDETIVDYLKENCDMPDHYDSWDDYDEFDFYQNPAEHTVVHGGDECCEFF